MATKRLSGAQMRIAPKLDDNLEKILTYIRQSDADFLVFPELCLTGHHAEFSEKTLQNAWRQISAACRQSYTTALVGTACLADDGERFIQTRIYSHEGELLGTHEKLVPTEAERAIFTPGSELRTFEHLGVAFGCLIGNDLWVTPGFGPYPDPRLTYKLGERGVDLIFHNTDSSTSTSAILLPYHESNLMLRAMESKVYIVTVNAAGSGGPINSPSGIMGPEGNWLVQSPREGEHVFTYDLDLETG